MIAYVTLRKRKRTKRMVMSVICVIITVIIAFPMLYMLLNSFMSPAEVSSYYSDAKSMSVHIIPDRFSLENYYQILLRQSDMLNRFWLSLLLSSVIVCGQFIISRMAGYAFAKLDFKFKKGLLFILIILMVLPQQAMLVPNYILFKKINLLDTWWALIIPSAFQPFVAVLMIQVFKSVPDEIIEAAKIDGAGILRTIKQIVLPMGKSSAIRLIILTFLDAWNMVEQSVAFLSDSSKYQLSVYLAYFSRQNISTSFACGILSLVLGILMFMFYRDELAEGVNASDRL